MLLRVKQLLLKDAVTVFLPPIKGEDGKITTPVQTTANLPPFKNKHQFEGMTVYYHLLAGVALIDFDTSATTQLIPMSNIASAVLEDTEAAVLFQDTPYSLTSPPPLDTPGSDTGNPEPRGPSAPRNRETYDPRGGEPSSLRNEAAAAAKKAAAEKRKHRR